VRGPTLWKMTNGPRARLGLATAVTALLVIALSGCSLLPGGKLNPLLGMTFYVDPDSQAQTAALASSMSGDPAQDTKNLSRLAAQPAAIWLTPESYSVATVQGQVSKIMTAATTRSQVPIFVVYGVPNRDCNGSSSGGLFSDNDYAAWVNQISQGFNGLPAVVILEPDALALAGQCGNTPMRVEELTGAVNTLATTKAITYIDAGHSDWISPGTMAELLTQVGLAKTAGFATNVSNYVATGAEKNYAGQISMLAKDAHYVVDTSRNGLGTNGDWCNPPGRALGDTPAVTLELGPMDANLWIKAPGESDGMCNGGPAAGRWWNSRALSLATNAGWQ
jgi:endoglucanase